MRTLPDTPTFTRAEARALGWSDAAFSRAVRSGRLQRLRRGHFCRTPADAVLAATAAARAVTGSVISHRSAALVHGLPLVGTPPPVPELTVAPRGHVDVPGAHLYRATLPAEHVALVGASAVTSVARTLVDLARHRPTATAVAAMDAALHQRLVTVEELRDVLRLCWNWPRIPRASRAVALTDARAESPLESVSRLVIARLRLPPPRPQVLIVDPDGIVIARVDFYWDEVGVAGEADGALKYGEREDLLAEKARQEAAEDLGLHFVRWGWDQAVHRPRLLGARLVAGFERGRARDRSGFTRRWSVRDP